MPSGRREPRARGAVARAATELFSDGGLARASVSDPGSVRELLVALVLRAAAGAAASSGAVYRRDDALEQIAMWIARGTASFERAGATTTALTVDQLGFSDVARLAEFVSSRAARVLVDAAGAYAGDLGVCYEELLELGVRELTCPSFRIRPDGVWIAGRVLLETEPAARSKWLQRETGLPKTVVTRLGASLFAARTERELGVALGPVLMPTAPAGAKGEIVLDASVARRRSGSHYTPPDLARAVIARTLAPLVDGLASDALFALRICDPAMGTGAFLVEAGAFLAGCVMVARRREGRLHGGLDEAEIRTNINRQIARECLFGVDKDPIAADLARWTVARWAGAAENRPLDLSHSLRAGDALVGSVSKAARTEETLGISGTVFFDWAKEFPEIFDRATPGFDSCVGNPPWVAYAGRAAQPILPELAAYYGETNPAFHGYRTLHGLFTRRAAEILRPRGRLGLVVPTSMADLDGYAAARLAHDALAVVDGELMDFGNGAFHGVFQPCMGLTSTRRAEAVNGVAPSIWPLARPDLDAPSAALLARLGRLPKVAPTLFGERGFQTSGDDLAHLRRAAAPEPPFVTPIREGTDVCEFGARPPRNFLNAERLAGRFRPLADWKTVHVLIRQTARYPIAALADGLPFRNSILAGFASDAWTAPALVGYLNSSAVRWYHFVRNRDARQGMPQLKIGHLRALPEIPNDADRARLDSVGRSLSARARAILPEERATLDAAAFDALAFSDEERRLVTAWFAANPPPKPRGS